MNSSMRRKLLNIGTLSALVVISVFTLNVTNYPVFSQEFGVSVVTEYVELSALENDSSLIVDIIVEESEYFMYEEVPFTLSKVKIKNVYKGEAKRGDIITILETGGIFNNVEYSVETDEILKKKNQAILYLYEYEGPIKEGIDKFVVTGLHQGKFKYRNSFNNIVSTEHNVGELAEVKSIVDLKLKE